MYSLKHFLLHYPEVTDDQALTFVRNTGDSLDGLALHLDRARGAGVTLKEYFGSSGKAPPRTKAVANPLDAACDRLKERLRQRYGDQDGAALVDRFADQAAPMGETVATGGQISDNEKMPVATKSARLPDPWKAVIRDAKGNRLP